LRRRTCLKHFQSGAALMLGQSRSLVRPGLSYVPQRIDVRTRAIAFPDETMTKITERVLPLRNGSKVKVVVNTSATGRQVVDLETDLQAGRLLLHWGVEGGKNYKGGWRLPGGSSRPEGTIQYKDRALQTPWRSGPNGSSVLRLELNGDEASDVLNFVLKDDATNTWYDNNGTNFTVALRKPQGSTDSALSSTEDVMDGSVLPKDLCDRWAWVRWDQAGRPSRSEKQAAEDYSRGVQEMREVLLKGATLDELWKVANGQVKYDDFKVKRGGSNIVAAPPKAAAPPAQAPPKQLPPIPDELIGVQAYVLWERAGKPDGADFGVEARRVIEEAARGGLSYEDIAARLNYVPKWTQQPQKQQQQPQQQQAASPPPQRAAAAPPQVGQPLGNAARRNPLDMIKRVSAAPVLSESSSSKREKPLDFLVQQFALDPTTKWRRTFALGDKSELLAVVRQEHPMAPVRVDLITDLASEVVLHWGVSKPGSREWRMAPSELWPEDTHTTGHIACETQLLDCNDDECDVEIAGARVPLQRLTIMLPPDHDTGALVFVLRSSDGTMWYKDAGNNFSVPVPCKGTEGKVVEDPVSQLPDDLSRAIVDAEVNTSQWTLMHRFNKATDLMNEVLNGYFDMDVADAMSRIYVWLRYSSTRQLTWQRNYNTQPRILSAAQERLTNAISTAHSRTTGEAQEWVRLMLTTVGRGGDGQRIRDEILHIMHRNHIPEKKGLWMEEWHQKLHNNTTPDDVPICEAYLAFLQSNGNISAYWRVLSDAGITRERLEGFDRPIVTEPQYYGDKRDALIRDFRNYLGILKSVHAGADLQASASAAGNRIPGSARGYLGYVLSRLGDSQVLPFMEAAVEARAELAPALAGSRELLYLDLALEDQVRQAAERGVGAAGFGAVAFMKPLLQNLCLSLGDNEELCYCLKTWQELPASVRTGGRPSKEEALQAVAVINRIRRAISEVSDNVVRRIGKVSKLYGQAFGVESWAYELFAEEVVRGGPAFAVSLLISAVEPTLRNAAALGAWQVISPTEATGVVEVVEGLHLVQDKTYNVPTVLLAEQVTGEEEIPEGVVAVLTPDAPDVLSHVSVRARNMHVLFATCHDKGPLDQIRAAKGKTLHFTTTASGSVTWTEAKASDAAAAAQEAAKNMPAKGLKIEVPKWCGKWAVQMSEYRNGVVGAKSKNLASLQGKLPAEIKLPASVTLPFGCFEQVLDMPENKQIKSRLNDLVGKLVSQKPASGGAKLLSAVSSMWSMDQNDMARAHHGAHVSAAEVLGECRKLAMQVQVPRAVRDDLEAAMRTAGLPVPENDQRWAAALEALKGVWASKYNDRAFYSMRKVGLNFDDVRMAVLVQRVVPAQYAFVIHTKNPSNNDAKEVFCEMVRGLGESLVSGMVAGSAIAFKASKDALDNPEVLCYASKSEAMFVRESLIFRSDSNGEDLEGYAGAGLYESITMDPTETKRVDYMDDKLVQDPKYRQSLLSSICKVGAAIEKALGSAQDIEGVVAPDNSITVVQTRPQV